MTTDDATKVKTTISEINEALNEIARRSARESLERALAALAAGDSDYVCRAACATDAARHALSVIS